MRISGLLKAESQRDKNGRYRRVLLKMLPNQEGRNKYFIFSMQSKWEQICGANVAKHSKPVRFGTQSFII